MFLQRHLQQHLLYTQHAIMTIAPYILQSVALPFQKGKA